MRSLISLFCLISLTTAWNLTLTPHGERLSNRRSGDNFLVVCKVKEFDGAATDAKVEWFRDGNKVSRFGSVMTIQTPYAKQLLINKPKPSDGGSYVCKAEVAGETQELTADISFVDPPKFVDPEMEQHPEEGTTAEIKCQVEGTENLEVFWQFNGVTLDESSPRGYDFKDDKQTLVIKNYNSKKDDGVYNCNAAQFASFETLSIEVSGYSRPVITVFDIPVNGRGFEGHSAQLKCGAVGKPKPTYKWLNQEGEEIENSDKYKVEDGLLVIESLSSEDAGDYKCIASNDVGDDTKTATLSVFLKPRIERMVDITKKTNEDVEIVCRFSGEGDLKAKFVFGEQEFEVIDEAETTTASEDEDNEDDVTSAEVTEAEESTTTATADDDDNDNNNDENTDDENDEATTSESTTTAADEDEDEETTTATASAEKEEDNVADEEEEEENTRWKRFVDDVNNEKVSIRAEGNSLILTLRQLSLEDAGAYKCLVENEAGTTNRTANLAITHAPILKSSSEDVVRSFDGNTVTVYCEVSAVPEPKWLWTKDGDEVEADGSSVIIDTSGSTSRLTVENKEGNNYGSYKCTADNGIGELSHEMRIIQIVAPTTPEGLDCKQLIYPNYGKCFLSEGAYESEESEPTEIEFQVAKLEDVTANFEWEAARIIRVDYDSKGMSIPDLEPSTQYQVRAKAINEAGESDFTEIPANMETTEPWAPKEPEDVKLDCEEICTVSWSAPNDHGSDITGYIVTVEEMTKNEEGEMEPVGYKFTIDVSSEDKSVELSGIKPHSFYKISVKATNSIGPGEPTIIEEATEDFPTASFDSNVLLPKLVIAAAVALVVLLCLVDFICFKSNRCGLIACILLNCCGRNPSDRKEKDLEAGRGETGRLLDNQTR